MSAFLSSYDESQLTAIMNWSFGIATFLILAGAVAGVVSHLASARKGELAAIAQQKADEERKEARAAADAAEARVEALEETAPRVLSSQQLTQLRSLLADTPAGAVKIVARTGVSDALGLANQIRGVLVGLGWEIDGPGNEIHLGRPPVGNDVFFTVPSELADEQLDQSQLPVHGVRLQAALTQVGLPVRGTARRGEDDTYSVQVVLQIGLPGRPE